MEDFNLLYAEEVDAWILQTSEEVDEEGKARGIVIFMGKKRPLSEQQDELLDLIIMGHENKIYYEEILMFLTNGF